MWQVETPTPHLGGRSLFRGGFAFRARLLDRADDFSARGRLDGRAGAARRTGLPGRPGPGYEREDREVRPGLSVRRGDAGRGNRGTRSGGKGTDRDAGILVAGYRSSPSFLELPADKFEAYLKEEGL